MEILVVEDDPSTLMLLEKILLHHGHRVVTAVNGRRAWEILQHKSIPLVITDWQMPEMNGLELCQHIRAAQTDHYTYIILVTRVEDKGELLEIYKQGADDYIQKPVHIEELHARIKAGERIIQLEQNHAILQHSLIESRNKLRIVFDSLPEQIVSIDADSQIVSANTAFLMAKGIDANQTVGTDCFESRYWDIPPINLAYLKQHALNIFHSGTSRNLTETTSGSDQIKRHFQFNLLPVRDNSGNVNQVVIVSKDITEELRRSEQIHSLNRDLQKALNTVQDKNRELVETLGRLQETQSQMLQSEKMASIGQLATGVAHEINNPVGFVGSNLKTLIDYQKDIVQVISEYRKMVAFVSETEDGAVIPETLQTQADRVRKIESEIDISFILEDIPGLVHESLDGLDRIKKIVLDLKNFSHPGEDALKLTDINQNLDSTLNIVWNELKYKATIIKNYSELAHVKCYPQQINQVFMNLLVNAVQAIEKQGEIRISTRQIEDMVEIVISDNGMGIPEENLNRIFDPFFTTKPVGKGTGLGLNVSYNIINKHEGTIDVRSEKGKGTTFNIRIPINGPAKTLPETEKLGIGETP